MTQSVFAELLGTDQSTVSRWESGATPETTHLLKLADLAGEDPGDFAWGDPHPYSTYEQEVKVVGAVEAGQWEEAAQWPPDEHFRIELPPDTRFPDVRRFGLIVRGPSMNLLYPHDSIVICAKYIDLDEQPKHGQKVVVIRKDEHGLFEATVKEYVVDNDGDVWLRPKSDHPAHTTALRFESPSNEDDSIVIQSRVLAVYREE